MMARIPSHAADYVGRLRFQPSHFAPADPIKPMSTHRTQVPDGINHSGPSSQTLTR